MSVRQHPTKGKGWWVIDTGRGKNRTRYVYNGTYADAVLLEESTRALLKKEKNRVSPDARIKKLILPFLGWYKNEVAATTLEDINDTIDLYLIPHFGNLSPDMLTLDHFNDFKQTLLDRGLKPATINKHLNYFSSLLKWAVANDKCKPLGFTIPRFSKKKTAAPPTKPLTRRQLNAVYKNIQPHYRLLFLLMADQGLRQTEAMTLKVEDVDEEYKAIVVRGKGGKIRRVPYLSDRFEDELKKALDERLEGYLVINPKTEKPYATIRTEINRAVVKAGLNRKVNHHLLRHTCATLLAESGMNPHALQRILGHSSIETTNKIYTNVSRDFVGDEAMKIRKKLKE